MKLSVAGIVAFIALLLLELVSTNEERVTRKSSDDAYLDPCKAAGYIGDVALSEEEFANAKRWAMKQTAGDSILEVETEVGALPTKEARDFGRLDEELQAVENYMHQELKDKLRAKVNVCKMKDKEVCRQGKIKLRDEIMNIRINLMRLKAQQRLLKSKEHQVSSKRSIANVESQSMPSNKNPPNNIFENVHLNSSCGTNKENCLIKKRSVFTAHSRRRRGAINNKKRLWNDGVIPFTVDSVFTSKDRATFRMATELWEKNTCLIFKEKELEDDHYIYFTKGQCGCCSYVGRGGGKQAISIGKGCNVIGIVAHELGHVIGFYHEHTRPDRNDYVNVVYENIQQGEKYNYNIQHDIDSLNETYDYDSIMHYSKDLFATKNGLNTLEPHKKPGQLFLTEIGQRMHPSAGDLRQVNKLYRCPTCGRTFHLHSSKFGHLPQLGKSDVCQWRIVGAQGERIVLTFSSLDIPDSDKCEMDYLEVRDGHYAKSPLIHRVCGSQIPDPIISTGNRMWIEFKTSNGVGNGFNVSYVAECGGDINKEEGFLVSPNYPHDYPARKECVWTITVPDNFSVAIMFEHFDLQSSSRCSRDHVEVRDGISKYAPLIDTFCGIQMPRNIQSSGRYMYVKFVSDYAIQKSGFSARFVKEIDECSTDDHGCQQVCVNTFGSYHCKCRIEYQLHSDGKRCEPACGGIIEDRSGNITSPSFPDLYPADRKCTWQIKAPPGYKIYFNFTYFDLETRGIECGYDSVKVMSEVHGYVYGVFCGYLIPGPILTSGNTLRIEFSSDLTVQNTGFAADFVTERDECSALNGGCDHTCINTVGSYRCECNSEFVLDADQHTCKPKRCHFEYHEHYGYIRSTNFPNFYPNRENCSWLVLAEEGHRVRLTFKFIEIEPHQLCDYDHIAIYDGNSAVSPLLGKFCGTTLPDPVIANGSSIFMTFFSDASVQRLGFNIKYDVVCGADLVASEEEKVFTSHPAYGEENYESRQDCQWTIRAQEPGFIQLRFQFFDLENQPECVYDVVTIYDGLHDTDDVIGEYCGFERPDTILSSTGNLLIHFISDDTINGKGFSATYQLVPTAINV